MDDSGCVFCAIVRREAAASIVHEDDTTLAFMDHRPVTPGHLLVVPKAHAVGLEDLDERVGAAVWLVAHRLGRALRRSGLRCEGVNLFLADGVAAFQEVFHVHLHVFPRFAGDGFRLDADWRPRDRGELDRSAEALRLGITRSGPAPRDDASPDEESPLSESSVSESPVLDAPVFEIAEYSDAHDAIRAYRENGVVIVDYRAADEATRRRVADICTGAGLARGFSPFVLAEEVLFLTTERFPTRNERQRFRS